MTTIDDLTAERDRLMADYRRLQAELKPIAERLTAIVHELFVQTHDFEANLIIQRERAGDRIERYRHAEPGESKFYVNGEPVDDANGDLERAWHELIAGWRIDQSYSGAFASIDWSPEEDSSDDMV